jgi:23S rRNA (adenine2030-N6)-methyltransferase
MLSYRHGFHAGNPADVLKHSILIFCLDHLMLKEKPLLCVDTHAGAGFYSLDRGFAAKNREWEAGLGRLVKETAFPSMLKKYLEIVRASGESDSIPSVYPGSPAIMARLLRPADRIACFELHPEDFRILDENMGKDRRFSLGQEDGFEGLRALLPPPSRRGLILIDPPYEVKDDYSRLPEILCAALRRFSTGTYIIWYPLLRKSPLPGGEALRLSEELMALYRGKRCILELYTGDKLSENPSSENKPPEDTLPWGNSPKGNSPRGMYGSGLVIYNPPWTLKAALEESLPVMARLMGAGWKLEFSGDSE